MPIISLEAALGRGAGALAKREDPQPIDIHRSNGGDAYVLKLWPRALSGPLIALINNRATIHGGIDVGAVMVETVRLGIDKAALDGDFIDFETKENPTEKYYGVWIRPMPEQLLNVLTDIELRRLHGIIIAISRMDEKALNRLLFSENGVTNSPDAPAPTTEGESPAETGNATDAVPASNSSTSRAPK